MIVAYEAVAATPRVLDASTYMAVNEWVVEQLVSNGEDRDGYVRSPHGLVHRDAFVAHDATIVGPVLVGPGARVLSGAVVVGPTSIGCDAINRMRGAGVTLGRLETVHHRRARHSRSVHRRRRRGHRGRHADVSPRRDARPAVRCWKRRGLRSRPAAHRRNPRWRSAPDLDVWCSARAGRARRLRHESLAGSPGFAARVSRVAADAVGHSCSSRSARGR